VKLEEIETEQFFVILMLTILIVVTFIELLSSLQADSFLLL
jgi:hypothetical protein